MPLTDSTCEHYREMVRLRRNLHDGLGPGLAGIMLRAEVIGELLDGDGGTARKMLDELRGEAAAFLAEFRRMLADQCPSELDGHGLAEALAELASRMCRATGGALAVTVDVDPLAVDARHDTQVAAFLIAKEALTNVVKHADADSCAIRAATEGGRGARRLWLTVTDNGTGRKNLTGSGVGLGSMRGRATELGGWCDVTATRAGVTVTASLPE